jgi:hypothetical protein
VYIKVPFKKEFKKVVHNNYIQKTKDKLSKLTDNSKLYLYNKKYTVTRNENKSIHAHGPLTLFSDTDVLVKALYMIHVYITEG